MPKMFQNTFGGPDPLGEFKRFPRCPSPMGVLLLRGRRGKGGLGKGSRRDGLFLGRETNRQ